MNRHVRFYLWLVTASALSYAQFFWLVMGHPQWGLVVGEFFVAAMVALLLTTPPDAIRVPRQISEGILFFGTLSLQLAAANRLPYVALVTLACLILLTTARRANGSPWWVAVVTWNPLVTLGPLALQALR